tara:strand:- start:2066 stop:3457 length:1392 start_codon:yes stop_codon:yes gene_type:complete
MSDYRNNLYKCISKLKETVITGKSSTFKWRIDQINKINKLLDDNKPEIINALYLDLGKSKIEALSEILLIKEEISLVKRKLKSWMRPKKIKTPFYLFPSSSKVIFEPLGCVLILGPYNYPLLYILKPLVNIFSAGNTSIIKPSEKCPETSKLLKKLLENYFQKDILITLEGSYKVAERLARSDFDHIFFTGSSETGKLIMKSASKNLTPLTLELSGTNPVIILKNANLKIAAKRIVMGKFFNSGQSCVAPNHLFVERIIFNQLILEIKKAIIDFYGKDPIKSKDLSKLESKQFERTLETLKNLKKNKKVIYGGLFSKKVSKISPTIVELKNKKDILLQKELFSSLLPIVQIDNYKTAIKLIQKQSKPLAIYVFGGNKNIHNQINQITSSGSICIDDVMLPVLIPNLPFGGIGKSGMGKFHGEEGFKNFSNQKSITYKSNFLDAEIRYPPYGKVLGFIKYFFKV